MTEEVNNLTTNPEKNIKRKKGIFPRLSLKKTFEIPKTIYDLGQGEPVRRLKIFDYLKKSPQSGPSRMLITTSGMYGLTIGSYGAERLTLTELGKSLVTTTSNKTKLNLSLDILFKNEIFSKFIEYWKDKALPSDDIAQDWLIRNSDLTKQDAEACWAIFKENILDNNLTQVLSGKTTIVSKTVALETIENDESIIETSIEDKTIVPHKNEDIENKRNIINDPKPFGAQVVERDFKYGRARLILPGEMTKDELKKIHTLIDSMVTEVNE